MSKSSMCTQRKSVSRPPEVQPSLVIGFVATVLSICRWGPAVCYLFQRATDENQDRSPVRSRLHAPVDKNPVARCRRPRYFVLGWFVEAGVWWRHFFERVRGKIVHPGQFPARVPVQLVIASPPQIINWRMAEAQ